MRATKAQDPAFSNGIEFFACSMNVVSAISNPLLIANLGLLGKFTSLIIYQIEIYIKKLKKSHSK